MNRTDGLVRRNKSRATENGNGEPNSSQATSVDENDVIIKDRDDDVDDTDSKETRLTLMEEVLLLGLKDKEVIIAGEWQQLTAVGIGGKRTIGWCKVQNALRNAKR